MRLAVPAFKSRLRCAEGCDYSKVAVMSLWYTTSCALIKRHQRRRKKTKVHATMESARHEVKLEMGGKEAGKRSGIGGDLVKLMGLWAAVKGVVVEDPRADQERQKKGRMKNLKISEELQEDEAKGRHEL